MAVQDVEMKTQSRGQKQKRHDTVQAFTYVKIRSLLWSDNDCRISRFLVQLKVEAGSKSNMALYKLSQG